MQSNLSRHVSKFDSFGMKTHQVIISFDTDISNLYQIVTKITQNVLVNYLTHTQN